MNILLRTLGGRQWMGGISYIINLVRAIRSTDPDVRLFHLGPVSDIYEGKVSFDDIVMESSFQPVYQQNRYFPVFILKRVLRRTTTPNTVSLPSIDVAFALFDSKLDISFPSIQWIPDFQHKIFPENFSPDEITSRDSIYAEFAQKAPIVILSSESAQRDFITYFPEYAGKSRVLRFVKSYTEDELCAEYSYITSKYSVPDSFYYLPNQFWKHKNHIVVIEALKLLRVRGVKPNVVFTGHTYDYRYPTYFDDFLKTAAEYGLNQQLHILGVVPYGDMLALMKQARAIINPSLCEGWSTTVEEAKSLCKRIILSDIEVHIEQAPEKGIYFTSGSPESLSEVIKNVHDEENCDAFDPQQAESSIVHRQKVFGQEFLNICKEAISVS